MSYTNEGNIMGPCCWTNTVNYQTQDSNEALIKLYEEKITY